jgi:hypothetical protein
LKAPEATEDRRSDVIDTFEAFRGREQCEISSLDLHVPFSPRCNDRQSLLMAMKDGGRVGFNAPYIPRGCDMRWFSTAEICSIVARFEKVYIVGDSLMRNLASALNILIREDMLHGALMDWGMDEEKYFYRIQPIKVYRPQRLTKAIGRKNVAAEISS